MLLIVAILLFAQAAEPPSEGLNTPESPAGQYLIGAGDVLQIQVYGEPELSGTFPVNVAGELDYPLLGAVNVQGMRASDVVALLKGRLMPNYLVNPHVTVWLSAYNSQPVQVLGAVAKPGVYFLRGPTSVLQILSEAGGVSQNVNEVRITHRQDDAVQSVPYDQLLSQNIDNNILQSGDVIYVVQSLVSVMGEVHKPGEISYRTGLTVSDCIAAAGGALPTAALGQIYIVRGETRIRVNLRKILNGKSSDVAVMPGDRIFVQESSV